MDFVYLLRVLLKRKWIIIGSTILAALIAWFFTKDEKKQYRSISQVSTGYTTNDVVKMGEEQNNDFFQADVKFNNAIVTFTSPTVISLLSYRVMLHDLQNPLNAFRTLTDEQKKSDVYREVNSLAAIRLLDNKLDSMSILTSYKPQEKKMLEYLKLYGYDYNSIADYLSVYRLEHTDYIQINYTSENPELSAFLVNDVFKEFVRYFAYVRDERSSESLDTLRNLLEQKRLSRTQANQAVASTGALDIDNSSKSNFQLISDLKQKLVDEQNDLITNQLSLQNIKDQLANIVPTSAQTVDNSEVLRLQKQMNDAQQAYINSGSTDQSLLNKYNDLKRQYLSKASSSSVVNNSPTSTVDKAGLIQKKNELEVKIQAGQIHINSFQNQIDQLQGNVTSQASKNAVAQSLSKDADLSDEEYSDLLKKYNAALDQNIAFTNNFHQILKGQPAIEPEPSKRFLIVGMAGSAVFILSLLIIIFLTYLDSSIKTPTIFSRVVNLKLLSMVNFMNLKDKMLADVIANTAVTENAEEKSRNNAFRESLRKLRFEIEHSGKKVLLFTSTRKGQGKTTLIQSLAYSFSLSKKKILIIDTNFCNNDLTVQLHGTPVLEQIVANEVNDQVIEDVTKAAVDVHGGAVYVIGCGGGDYTPSEILPAKNILLHLKKLTKVYDYVFLEGPPLNEFSDSKELTEYVDGVVAIFSAKHIIKQIDKDSIGFFKGLNGKFCGSVLNMVELENLNDA